VLYCGETIVLLPTGYLLDTVFVLVNQWHIAGCPQDSIVYLGEPMVCSRAENRPKIFGPARRPPGPARPVSLIVPNLDPTSISEDSV
jgi:hypothetical protein